MRRDGGLTAIERIKGSWLEKATSLVLALTLPAALMPGEALALPHGAVTKGTATLSYSTNKLLIGQSTSTATFSWSSYNVGSTQTVQYRTPGASSVSLNMIGGTTPAEIAGKVVSNGQLVFMDPNGIVFGAGSSVSAAGIQAYGANTGSGTITPTGAVTNAGTLTAGANGQIILVGTSVTNTGTIVAPSGQIVLAAGSTVTLSQSSSSSLSVATTGGGSVYDSGILSAENVDGTPGAITLKSGMSTGTTTLASTAVLDASAPASGSGGSITVDGHTVVLDQVAPLDVSAPYGSPGTITIDPTTTDVGTASALEAIDASQGTYLNTSSVCIVLTASINLGGYSWTPLGISSTSAFTGTFNGNGHTVSGYTITASGSNGTGFIGYLGSTGVVENLGVSGAVNGGINYNIGGLIGENNGGTVEYSYNTGNISGASNIGGIVGNNGGGTVEYSYNTGSITGSGNAIGGIVGYNTGIATSNTGGSNNGSNSGQYGGGPVGGAGGRVSVGPGGNANTNTVVNGSTGANGGTVEYSYNTGSVTGSSAVGGIIGYNTGGNGGNGGQGLSGTGGATTGGSTGGQPGGGTGAYGYTGTPGNGPGGGACGRISLGPGGNPNLGSTNPGGPGGNGGNGGTVAYSYNTGSITGSGNDIGGLVGYNTGGTGGQGGIGPGGLSGTGGTGGQGGTMEYSYNTGNVKGSGYVGGIVGDNTGGAGGPAGISTDNYWNSSAAISPANTTGVGNASSVVSGVTALTSSQFGVATNFAGFSFNRFSSGEFQSSATTSPWFMATVFPNGGTTGITAPILVADLPVATVTSTSGTSVYNGQAVLITQNVSMGGTGLTVGPNAGTYGPDTLSAPSTQMSVGSFSSSSTSWSWTITPAPLSPTGTSTTTGIKSSPDLFSPPPIMNISMNTNMNTQALSSQQGSFASLSQLIFSQSTLWTSSSILTEEDTTSSPLPYESKQNEVKQKHLLTVEDIQ